MAIGHLSASTQCLAHGRCSINKSGVCGPQCGQRMIEAPFGNHAQEKSILYPIYPQFLGPVRDISLHFGLLYTLTLIF
jgi:hypothetical protein